jgi:hypothetical protein
VKGKCLRPLGFASCGDQRHIVVLLVTFEFPGFTFVALMMLAYFFKAGNEYGWRA